MSDIWPVKVNLDIKADLTKSAEDIAAMAKDTHKGVGKLVYAAFGPWIEERVGKAKRVAAQAEKDSLDILAGRARLDEETKTMVPIGDVSNIDALCEELENVNSKCKAKRLAAALMTASIEMKQVPEEEVSDEPLNQTFFNHWRAEAELIDDEDLRKWWAHLLVEETKKPNSISPRTLDVVKNLSREEAEIFLRLIKGYVEGIIFADAQGQPVYGNFYETVMMEEAGLFTTKVARTYPSNYQDSNFGKQIILPFMEDNLLIAIDGDTFALTGNMLTKAGRELLHIFRKSLSENDIIKIGEHIFSARKDITISIHRVTNKIFDDMGKVKRYEWNRIPIWTNHSFKDVENIK